MSETTTSKEPAVNETTSEAPRPPAPTDPDIQPEEAKKVAAAPPATVADRAATRRATSDVGALKALGIAAPLYGLMLLCARLAPADARAILLERGWPPHATLVLTAVAIAILSVKAIGLRRQRRAFALALLPEGAGRIGQEAARQLVDSVEMVRGVRGPRSFLVERVLRVLTQYAAHGDVAEANAANDADADADASAVAASFSTVKVLVWAMPILGLIGTVIGLSGAVGSFSHAMSGAEQLDTIKESLREVTTGLAVAFDATFVALVASILVMLPMTWLQKAEDKLVNDVDDYTVTNILARLGGEERTAGAKAEEAPAPADEIRKAVIEALAQPLAEMLAANAKVMDRLAEDRNAVAAAEGALVAQLSAFAAALHETVPAMERAAAQLERTTAAVGPGVDRVAAEMGRATEAMGSSVERVVAELGKSAGAVGPSVERAILGLDKTGAQMERAVAQLERATAQIESRVAPSVERAASQIERAGTGVERAVTQLEVTTAVADQAATAAERAQDQLSRELGASRQLLSLLAAGLGAGDALTAKPRHVSGANGTNGANGTAHGG